MRRALPYLIIFTLSWAIFCYLQSTAGLADPDAFYHIKISKIIAEQGIPKEFSNLPYTIFTRYFTDHHLLYHLMLAPFVTWFDPIIGAKLSQIFFASICVLVFYSLLRRFKVQWPSIFVLALLATAPFIFRVSLIKVPALSISVLLLSIFLIAKRKYVTLALLSCLYVWLYGGFLLILIASGCFVLADALSTFVKTRPHSREFIRQVFSRDRLALLAAPFAGIVAGLVINPYFPQNLYFYWQQLIQIGVINYQQVIGVGTEWYPYPLSELLIICLLPILAIITAVALTIIIRQKLTRENLALFLLALFFFAFTLKSRRYVEYFVPFSLLWSAVAMRDAVGPLPDWRELLEKLRTFWKHELLSAVVLAVYVGIALPLYSIISVRNARSAMVDYPVDKFSGAGRWLSENARSGEMVFHNDWDDFPILYYYAAQVNYVIGLDPTFMYKVEPDLYWKWVNITLGKQSLNLADTIRGDFGAKYVFVDADHIDLENNIKKDKAFELVFKDTEAAIYKLP